MILFLDQSIKKVEAVHFTVLCTTLYSLTLNSDDSGNRFFSFLRIVSVDYYESVEERFFFQIFFYLLDINQNWRKN